MMPTTTFVLQFFSNWTSHKCGNTQGPTVANGDLLFFLKKRKENDNKLRISALATLLIGVLGRHCL